MLVEYMLPVETGGSLRTSGLLPQAANATMSAHEQAARRTAANRPDCLRIGLCSS
jgi:hypothetical protein